MENMEFYNKFRTPPAEALRPITAGRLKGKTDINPMWRIQALTELFGPCGVCWTVNLEERWTSAASETGEVACFMRVALRYRIDNEWREVQGIGGSMLIAKERNGFYLDDDAYKKAWTDAIGVCCKQLGIGADVYWGEGSKYGKPEPTINEKQLQGIRAALATYQVPEEEICKRYQLKRLEDMTHQQYKAFHKDWNTIKGEKGDGPDGEDQQPVEGLPDEKAGDNSGG